MGNEIRLTSLQRRKTLEIISSKGIRVGECLELRQHIGLQGYPRLWFYYKKRLITRNAHRVAYAAYYRLLPTGLVVAHLCNNRLCVRKEHLKATTQTENCAMRLNNPKQHKTSKRIKAYMKIYNKKYYLKNRAKLLVLHRIAADRYRMRKNQGA